MTTSPPTSVTAMRGTLIGAAFLSLQPLLLNALSVPAMAYIIRQLGAAGYAQWMTAVSVIAFLTVLTNLGLRAAFVRSVAGHPGGAASALSEQLGLRIGLSLAAGVAAVGVCAALGYPEEVIACAAVGACGLVISSIATTLADLLQAVQKLRTLAVVNLIAGLVLTASSVIVAWWGAGPVALAAVYLAGPLVSTCALAGITARKVCRVTVAWKPRRFKSLLVESRFLAAQQLLFAGSAQAEALLSPRLLGMNRFGVFAAGSMLGNRLVTLPDALCAAAYPVMVRAQRQGQLVAVMYRYLAVAVLGGVAVAVGGWAIAAPLGRLLLPEHADAFAQVVRITMWSVPLIGIELVIGYSLAAAGKDALQARWALPSAVSCLAVSVAFVLGFGLVGACWSMVVRPAVRAGFLAALALRTFRSAADKPVWHIASMRKAG